MERGQTAAESRRRDGPENKDASRRWGWAHLEGMLSLSVDNRSGPVVRRWTDRGIYLITSGSFFKKKKGGGLRFCECAANQHHRICDEADPAGWFGSCCGVSGADAGQRIMVRNIPDDAVLSPRFLLLSPSIITRVPCVDPMLLEVPSHEESSPRPLLLAQASGSGFPWYIQRQSGLSTFALDNDVIDLHGHAALILDRSALGHQVVRHTNNWTIYWLKVSQKDPSSVVSPLFIAFLPN